MRVKDKGSRGADSAGTIPVMKNEDYVAEIVGLGHDGEGVGRVNGFTLFIPGALPGEKVRTKVVKLKKQYGYGKLLEVLERSPERVEAPCAIYAQCGGCQLQHLGYEAQLRHKRQLVVDNLERIGKLKVAAGDGTSDSDLNAGLRNGTEVRAEDPADGYTGEISDSERGAHIGRFEGSAHFGRSEGDAYIGDSGKGAHHGIVVHPTIGMLKPWRYRNKAQVPIGEIEGGLVGGFYSQGSHRIVDMDECLIQHERNDEVVRRVKSIAQELGIRPYNEESHKGLLRHVVVKIGFRTGEVMVVLVTNGEQIPHGEELVGLIRRDIDGVKSICHNINTARTNVIFGDKTKVLWGSELIYDYIGDVKFAISARSFYQVNPVQTEVLYGKTVEYAGLTGKETVIDAYCGIGTISLFLARHAKRVYGVEIVREAIEDARKNADLNEIGNVEFAVGKAEEVIPAWKREGIEPDVIVVDPPRKGCDRVLLDTILEMKPERVVYVSCNPSTLARDLQVLEAGGYRTLEVQPVDMFPHTVHVECCVSLHFNK
jgi:23S rRNA (uracil1939-C5)-methyltransferase